MLKRLFGHNTSVFASCNAYLTTHRNGEPPTDYTEMVNRRHEMAEFNTDCTDFMVNAEERRPAPAKIEEIHAMPLANDAH
ncbi:unnamed protein product [Toxocara canis]|uniref:Lipoprotein n=1 Tax=Toxocara canis TaxID=6265 RepID=A0A183U2F0_TOXCA|nr:unnamed protein product [Toxocara canis]